MVNNRRSEVEIIERILHLSCNGARRTEILYQGNLSYLQLQKYLPYLLEKKILQENKVRNNTNSYRSYKTTEKGSKLLQDIRKVMNHLV